MCTGAEMAFWRLQQTKKNRVYPKGAIVGYDTYLIPKRPQKNQFVCGDSVYHLNGWISNRTYLHTTKGNGYFLQFLQEFSIVDDCPGKIWCQILTPYGVKEIPLYEVKSASENLKFFRMEVELFHGKSGEFDSPIHKKAVITFNGDSPSEVQLVAPKGFQVESFKEA